jgi:RNA polymerase sigma-70 factor (ECF subfamily)
VISSKRVKASFAELLSQVRAGDEHAAAELVREYQPMVERVVRVRLAHGRLGHVVGVSDVCQSVMASFFVRAALGQYELKTPEDLLRLLGVMARNKATDQQRRHRNAHAHVGLDGVSESALASAAPSPSRAVELSRLAREVRGRLSPELQQLLELRAQGLSWEQIGEQVGQKADALRKRMGRAVDELAAAFERDSRI